MYKPNTTDPEEIVSHLQDANIRLADVTCDVVMIGKLQDTCAPFQVKFICSSIFIFISVRPLQDSYRWTNKGFSIGVLTPIFLTTGILLYIWVQVKNKAKTSRIIAKRGCP